MTQSYAQFIKRWRENPILDVEGYTQLISDMNFNEDEEIEYEKLPLQILYLNLPIITDGVASVKVVAIIQADNFALIVPDNVHSIYEALLEDTTEEALAKINSSIELSIDTFGFGTSKPGFLGLVKQVYVEADNNKEPFQLEPSALAKAGKEEEPEEEELPDARRGIFQSPDEKGGNDFEEPGLDFVDTIKKEEAVYSKFTRQTESLNKLEQKLKRHPKVLVNNTYAKYLDEAKAVLMLVIDNKNIYNSLAAIPKKAKEVLSIFGETIRTNKDTQLLDSYIVNHKRVFIVAENSPSNYWIVENEKIDKLDETKATKIVSPIEYIVLPKSSIRRESRKAVPYLKEDKVVFVIKD